MKVGDIVRWTEVEEIYHKFCGHPIMEDLTVKRRCGIIVDNNGVNFFVRWENGDLRAQKPNTIEIVSESRQFTTIF